MFPGSRILNTTKTALGACLKEFREEGDFQAWRKSFQFLCYLGIPIQIKKKDENKKNMHNYQFQMLLEIHIYLVEISGTKW